MDGRSHIGRRKKKKTETASPASPMSSCIDVVTWVEVRVEEGLLDTLAEEVVLVLLPRRAYECQRIGNCSTGGVTSDDRPRVCHW